MVSTAAYADRCYSAFSACSNINTSGTVFTDDCRNTPCNFNGCGAAIGLCRNALYCHLLHRHTRCLHKRDSLRYLSCLRLQIPYRWQFPYHHIHWNLLHLRGHLLNLWLLRLHCRIPWPWLPPVSCDSRQFYSNKTLSEEASVSSQP